MLNKILAVFSGLSRDLLIWFLLLSLLPIVFFGWSSYQDARKNLLLAAEREMERIAEEKSKFIENWFEYRITDTKVQAKRESSRLLLKTLQAGYNPAKYSLMEYTKSFDWERRVDGLQDELRTLSSDYDYIYDIFLVDLKGNILFSTTRARLLGKNIFSRELAGLQFSEGLLHSLQSGETYFSDIEKDVFGEGLTIGTLSAPVLDEFGSKLGAIAIQIKMDRVISIMQGNAGIQSSLAQYIIGDDGFLRTPIAERPEILEHQIRTEIVLTWQQSLLRPQSSRTAEAFSKYTGMDNKLLYGKLYELDIPGSNWAMITEINQKELYVDADQLGQRTIFYGLLTSFFVILIAIYQALRITQPIGKLSSAMKNIEVGDLDQYIENSSSNELGILIDGFNNMTVKLQSSALQNDSQAWMREGINRLSTLTMGDKELEVQTMGIISFLCRRFTINLGTMYVTEDRQLVLRGSYALKEGSAFQKVINFGEGILGQVALDGHAQKITDIPDNYISLQSSLGRSQPKILIIHPIKWNRKVIAVLEFAAFSPLTSDQEEFLKLVEPTIASAILAAVSRDKTQVLLESSQAQAEELQSREEELQTSQRALEERNHQLQSQEEELRASNESLELQTQKLVLSKEITDEKVRELEQKSIELAKSSQYKTEFLANMSHELRTPLNSVLVLSKILSQNKNKNLDKKQIEFATTINTSGNDLLLLINDILDLAKIESGKVDINLATIPLQSFITEQTHRFNPIAEDKGIEFAIEYEDAPDEWLSDERKFDQIIKNLLSNAFKFTEKGKVILRISQAELFENNSSTPINSLVVAVEDNGIGIHQDKLESIFEAFKQADGSTSRKYGGTGLGLSISRELAKVIGGNLTVESQESEGSKFTLTIPLDLNEKTEISSRKNLASPDNISKAPKKDITSITDDDRSNINPDSRSILIIEDDPIFANVLKDISHDRGFKTLITQNGKTGIELAKTHLPSGIILDIGLPGMDGWQVLEELKSKSETRHIPVHFISANDNDRDAMSKGAIGFINKPVNINVLNKAFERIENIINSKIRNLLLIETRTNTELEIKKLIGSKDVKIASTNNIENALSILGKGNTDCIILGHGNTLEERRQILEQFVKSETTKKVPVVIYSENEMDEEEETLLIRYTKHLTIKHAPSAQRLLDETSLFLHRVEGDLPIEKQRELRMLHDKEQSLANRKVLVVDDDLRNVFALSAVLEEKEMKVSIAKDGIEALRKLEEIPDIDIVLMDIMMPRMDGYEATKRIREQANFLNLPIIALTANAMQEDKGKCIAAGANDYIAKPINNEKLLSVMRVWLSSSTGPSNLDA